MQNVTYQPGDPVVYCKTKHSTSPGPRATEIQPAARGDDYSYTVDKYWVVEEIHDDMVVLRTRRGKRHEMPMDDPNLRRASLLEKLIHRHRFPQLEDVAAH